MAEASSEAEARAFGAAFRSFLDWVHSAAAGAGAGNEVVALASGWLGADGAGQSVVSRDLPPFEHVNLQTALDAWSHAEGRTVAVHGIVLPPHWGPVSLQQLIGGEALPPLRLAAPELVDLPNGPSSTLACLKLALLLVHDPAGRYVVLIAAPLEHHQGLTVEIAGLPTRAAQAVHAELDGLRSRLNVYRGHVLDVGMSNMGGIVLSFAELPATPREAVVLPEAVLARVERHAFGIAEHRAQLLAAGQHLKRGLLLYGPPGTGKTHTTRYVVARMAGYTRLLLTGRSLHAVGSVAELARELAPAVVVLEDVDLVAEDRSFGPGSSPVLFDLLDAMDGADADADLLFLLTTNRADLLEPALAARPGRVDVAVEIELPDLQARRQLLALYSTGVPAQWSDADVEDVLESTAGVTASFLKELVRRAVLESLRDASPLTSVTGDQLRRAVGDLLDTSQQVTRSLLGVGGQPNGESSDLGATAGYGMAHPSLAGPAGPAGGWVAYTPGRGRLGRSWTPG
ncbi:AAA family ATPase [Jatrophihabitans sp.]|uniref:AAA family ATPase n=1 Tax=Jatrophihabitans sp. TaxID=1932789 RepID=UPI002EEF596F